MEFSSPPPPPTKANPPTFALDWAEKLKAQKNPFLAPTQNPGLKHELPFAMLGSMSVAAFNKLLTDKLPPKWHLPAHGALAISSLLLPSHPLSAAIGGAFFYSAISETYYKIVKSNLLDSVKNATK